MFSIRITNKGNWSRTTRYLSRARSLRFDRLLSSYGEKGVSALSSKTPVESGETAVSWAYRVQKTEGGYTLEWYNTNVNKGAVIAILLQYGHGTGTGGYVQGRDYINPAMQPLFDAMVEELCAEVKSL